MLAGLLGLLALLLGAAATLATTATGFRWLADAASALSGERLKLEGVSGHLGAPIAVKRLTLVTQLRRIEAEDLRLRWQPRALWERRLEVELLAARVVRVDVLREDPRPPQLPASLRLPLDVRVHAFDLGRLEMTNAASMQIFRRLHARLDGRGDRYRVSGARVLTPWADVTGRFELGKDAPFALQGSFDATRREPLPLHARLRLAGSLAALRFEGDATAEGMSVVASGEAAPFAEVRLRRVLLAGQGIDPRRLAPGAPTADLAFSGVFEGRAGERLIGTFSLSNALAGRLDQERLPLANLSGAVFGDVAAADFRALTVDLGAAGRFSGAGQWRNGRAVLDLVSPRVDLAALHGKLYPTRMATRLQFAGDLARQTLDGTFSERWGEGRFALSRDAARLRLETLQFRGRAGQLTASGEMQSDATRAFAARFDATRIDPAQFGKLPRARLNLRGALSGALAPQPRLLAEFTLPTGELEGSPIRGHGRLRYAEGHLADADIDLDLAGNRATFTGAYGRAGDRLDWNVDAPDLGRLKFGLDGQLTSRGSVAGDPAAPQVEMQLAARALRLPGGVAVEHADLALTLQATARGAFEGRVDARGVRVAGQRIATLSATLDGQRAAHTLALDASLPQGRLNATLAGGLGADSVWRGQLQKAALQGEWPIVLTAPATLVLGRAQQQVDGLVLSVAGGRVAIEHFSRRGTQLASRGSVDRFPLAPLRDLLEEGPRFTTDLRFAGNWKLRADETLDGTLSLRRQSGDLRLAEPALQLGLEALQLDLVAAANRVDARLAVESTRAGQLHATARAALVREGAAFTLNRAAPLAWNARFDVPDLRLAKAFLPVGIRLDAHLVGRLDGSGSIAAPRIDGVVDAQQIRFAMPEQGVAISDGTLRLALAGDRVRVQQGELKGAGGGGRIRVSGEAQLRNPQAGLTLEFEKFAAIQRSDRQVIVSGTTRLVIDPRHLELRGELTADRARLEMPGASRPMLSDDVVVVGRPPREKPAAQRFPLALDLRLRLGSDFLFDGGGLDARLGGELRVFTVDKVVRGEGTIRVEEGRYSAYGQTLAIERGVLRFVGPIDNPGLDVLAVRVTPAVKVGVQVGGTVQRPLVKLYSDPPLPDTEKLAWLVLGHGLEGSGQEEFVLMQVAAGALLSQAESVNVQAKLAETLGIDTFDVRSGGGEDLTSTVVSLGKRLSSRATLSYEQSLDGLHQFVKVLYQLTPHVRLEAQAGQQSSFDAFYTLEYD